MVGFSASFVQDICINVPFLNLNYINAVSLLTEPEEKQYSSDAVLTDLAPEVVS